MHYILRFLTVFLCALPAYGQTLPDFSRAVLAPLATKATEDEALQKRAFLARACASAKPKDWSDLLGLLSPQLKDVASTFSDTLSQEQAHDFCRLALEVLKDQTTSRLASRIADLELKTTASEIERTIVFSVCNEKTARQWKALPGGTFAQLSDVSC